MNTVSVHAAQRTGIHRHRRRGALPGNRRYRAVLPDAVSAQRQRQIFCMNTGVDFGGTRHDGNRVGIAAIQPLTFDNHRAFADVQRREVATGIQLRFAGGQRDVGRVDKAAAVTGNAIRVGDHHVGRFARHFGVALQLRATGTNHFVDDRARFPARLQVGVALNQAAKLGLRQPICAVVEDQAFLAHVILLILVMRHPRLIRCGDVNHRHAVTGGIHLRAGRHRRDDSGRRRQHRLHGNQITDQVAQCAPGQGNGLTIVHNHCLSDQKTRPMRA